MYSICKVDVNVIGKVTHCSCAECFLFPQFTTEYHVMFIKYSFSFLL